MSRQPRNAPTNCAHHIYARGNNKQDIFLEEIDYLYYLRLLNKNKKKYDVYVYHYALMKNHTHIMAITNHEKSLSKMMQSINVSYAMYFRKKYGGFGHLWQGRFKNVPILNESYYLKCINYIELNPVKAGFVKYPKDYKWSSYGAYAYGQNNEFIDIDPLYSIFGQSETERKVNYINFIDSIETAISMDFTLEGVVPVSPSCNGKPNLRNVPN